MSISLEEAGLRAEEFLKQLNAHRLVGAELVILRLKTMEWRLGWVFFIDSRRHQETGAIRDMVVGNGALVVLRADGRVLQASTSRRLQESLEIIEKQLSVEGKPEL